MTRDEILTKLNDIAKPCDMKAWSKRVVKNRITENACNFYLQQMQGGELMRAAQPDKIAKKMYLSLGIKCEHDESHVWIKNVQQKLF